MSMTKVVVATALLLASTLCARAEAPESTLARIAETGTLRIGYSPDAAPFSYLDADGSIIGYSIDLCARIAALVQQQLGMSKLDLVYVRRTPSDRVALLQDGQIDIECVASTNNAERRKSVAFSYPHFVTAVRFVALRDGGPRVLDDLKGRTVASTSGTTVIGDLNAISRAHNLNIAVTPTPDHETAFAMVTTGRVSAFVMDDVLLSNLVANSENPKLYQLSRDAIGSVEPYGLMMRRDDEPFKDAVNAALKQIFTEGEIGPIYDKWFTMPIAPHGIVLDLPVTAALADTFAHPVEIGK